MSCCEVCGGKLPPEVRRSGRHRRYCSSACRQRAYRQRARVRLAAGDEALGRSRERGFRTSRRLRSRDEYLQALHAEYAGKGRNSPQGPTQAPESAGGDLEALSSRLTATERELAAVEAKRDELAFFIRLLGADPGQLPDPGELRWEITAQSVRVLADEVERGAAPSPASPLIQDMAKIAGVLEHQALFPLPVNREQRRGLKKDKRR